MVWLTSLPAWALVVGCVGLALLAAAASRIALKAFIPLPERDSAFTIAAAIMTAIAAAFAVLMALTVANGANYLASAQGIVNSEAADASRLAWASTSAGVDSQGIQQALLAYLKATRTYEWHGPNAASGTDAATVDAIAHLEHVVRGQASRSILGTPASTELLSSVDAMTSDRRARLAVASHELPGLYVGTLALTGLALIVNAEVIALRGNRRTARTGLRVTHNRRPQPGITVRHWVSIARSDRGQRAANRLGHTKSADRLLSPVIIFTCNWP